MAAPSQTHHGDQYPEVVPQSGASFNIYDSSYEYYQAQESPAPEYIPQRSPAPEYQPYRDSRQVSSPSPRISSSSPPPLSSSFGRSPSTSDSGWKVRTPPVQYSEFHSPDPERVYSPPPPKIEEEKEYYNKAGTIASVVAASPLEYKHTISRKPVAISQPPPQAEIREKPKRPFYKRPLCLLLLLAVLAAVVVAVACGVVFGTKKSKAPSSNSPTPPNPANNSTQLNADPDLAVGGYLNSQWYSQSGAFNGSGVAVAAAKPGIDQTVNAFYQDYQGNIYFKLKRSDGTFGSPGMVNDLTSSKPLNGTPISVVNTFSANNTLLYHLFYVDANYYMVERVLSNNSNSADTDFGNQWADGHLTQQKLQTLKADTIGMQACLWNNYYGGYKSNAVYATDGIQLWFATDETTFAQYSWTNGTTVWNKDPSNWTGLDGHAGVGCQTWESWMLEYVFFVDVNQNIVVYWRDNNQSAVATTEHPTLEWVQVNNVSIPNVQKSSSLGYTIYMLYQDEDTSIRGVNINWAAENTSIATIPSTGAQDNFIIKDLATNNPVPAVRGTHLTITALKTASKGATLEVYFQGNGSNFVQYTRDMDSVGGIWQQGLNMV